MTLARDVVRFGDYLPTTEKSYAKIPQIMEMPNLIKVQLDSYEWFKNEGLRELLDEISPIQDFTGSKMELRFGEYSFGEPKYDERECRDRDATFAAPLRVKVELIVKETGEVKEQELFMGDFPLMTPTGTFIINGAERVVVSQLVRSPGVYFTREKDPTTGRDLAFAKVIPNRGAWLEFETSNRDVISVKVDRKRKIPVTTLLRAIDSVEGTKDQELGTAERVLQWFEDVDTNQDHHYLATTIDKETPEVKVGNKLRALEDFYKRMRPGDPPTLENARTLVNSLFFNPRRYDLLKVGRYKINRRLKIDTSMDTRVLTVDDIKGIIKELIRLNNGIGETDEIDHLGNRRVRAVGELIQNQFRIGLLRMERVVRERMTITDPDQATPSALINIRPVVAAMKEFFGGSQLSQFMDQTNPLAELTHKRKLSALGPGGLSRDHAGFDVRDVHHSHYGRICPIETPEGPNIGLIVSLASYAVINDYGFIETPYRRVIRELPADSSDLVGRILREDVVDGSKALGSAGEEVTPELADKLAPLGVKHIKVRPYASGEIHYLAADDEDQYVVAQANAIMDERGHFLEEEVEVRDGQRFDFTEPENIDFMDVSPKQILSTATSLIPFLEHDDAPRALMGSNMQRQAVPLLHPERPLVGTGTERQVAVDSGQVVIADRDGLVTSATARSVVVRYDDGEEVTYPVMKFLRSNAATCLNQRPVVTKGNRVKAGDSLVDSSSTQQGELALGQSVLCAFMSWEGYNFEDAIILSENVVRQDKFSSIHIEKHEIEARDTKLGPEEITRDIPNVGDESLKDLDEHGIIRIGAEVQAGDILVGKITPKGETELTAEEKLLRAIFGEKAREVKDTSLRVPHGQHGKVIDVRVFRREDHDELPAGVNELVRVSIAQKRKVSEGDKMAGRHGNKGVIARILPMEDMPYLADGTPVDIILNPIGVPSRMNVGQVLETHLGWAAGALGFRAVTPVFDGADDASIEAALARAWLAGEASALAPGISAETPNWGENLDIPVMEAWLKEHGYDFKKVFDETQPNDAKRACLELWFKSIEEPVKAKSSVEDLEKQAEEVSLRRRLAAPIFGKQLLYDGRTGDTFDQPVTVGQIYMLKLVHLVEEKIHARSTGPYSLITQQPLGGKAQMGGQRFGEMEVWALEAYGAAHTLQELLTVKSDDVVGRVKTYEAIVKGDDVLEPGIPESFKVLVKELQSLGLAVEVLNDDEEQVMFTEESEEETPRLGINLSGFENEDVMSERGL
ncbi:MAG TPA: DNA-directed RNA polymerase subunit beta [Dehalococcoidia bacterium]|nr:DNA-directed RNA polymerase subunit beta [Dehalococcoidia bacterium]